MLLGLAPGCPGSWRLSGPRAGGWGVEGPVSHGRGSSAGLVGFSQGRGTPALEGFPQALPFTCAQQHSWPLPTGCQDYPSPPNVTIKERRPRKIARCPLEEEVTELRTSAVKVLHSFLLVPAWLCETKPWLCPGSWSGQLGDWLAMLAGSVPVGVLCDLGIRTPKLLSQASVVPGQDVMSRGQVAWVESHGLLAPRWGP